MNRKKCNKKILYNPKQKLSNNDINSIMNCYENIYKDFLFLNALPIDSYKENVAKLYMKKTDFKNIYQKGIKKIGIVFNTDPSYKKGEHWVGLFLNMSPNLLEIEYFDSIGEFPSKNILKFINKYIKRAYDFNHKKVLMKVNVIEYQSKKDESNCGIFVLYFLILRLKGISFENLNKYINEGNIEKYRSILTRIK